MKSSNIPTSVEQIPAAKLEARQRFRLQLGLQTLKAQSDTSWEQVKCVGYNPQMRRLEAIVDIKRATGYNGTLCTQASREYVRFFVDFKDGGGFRDMGLTSFKAADISNAPAGPQHPLSYMVYLYIDDAQYRRFTDCSHAIIPTMRAILSWNDVPPPNPNHVPHYGNTKDADIQLQRRPFFFIKDVLDFVKTPVLKSILPPEWEIPLPEPQPAKLKALYEANQKAGVPDHRTFFSTLGAAMETPMSFADATAQFQLKDIGALKVDFSKFLDIFWDLPNEEKANVTYEQVTCVGLNTDTDTLGAVVHIKKTNGYSGDLCQKGSKEHVAFWADWNNNGVFDQYLGTVSFETHDIANMPAGGLFYNVALPIDLSRRLRACNNPNIIRVRAVLSWEALPSTTNPNQLNTWGNRIDALVQLRPGHNSGVHAAIHYVGNADRTLIHPSEHLFQYSVAPSQHNNRPWGGAINFRGIIDRNGFNGTIKYRLSYKKLGAPDSAYQPVSFNETFQRAYYPTLISVNVPQTADPQGWFIYDINPALGIHDANNNLLAHLHSGSLTDGHYTIRFEFTDEFGTIILDDLFSIVVCNKGMSVSPTANTSVDMTKDLDLVIDGGDCHSYDAADPTINGHLRAVHPFYASYTLEIQPTSHTNGATPSPSSDQYPSPFPNGPVNEPWTLNTTPLDPCGYAISLRASTRVILNGWLGFPEYGPKAVGFAKQP